MMSGAKLKDFQFKPHLDGYRACAKPLRRRQGAIKVPVFSPPYGGFPDVDKSLGPEKPTRLRFGFRRMKSTGEAIYFIKDLKDPFFRQVYGERSMYLSR